MSNFPWLRLTFVSAAFIGVGYAIMKSTTPTEEEVYNRMSPDLRKKVDAIRAARLEREQAVQQQVQAQLNDPDASKPVWADPSRRS
ncbi:CBP4 domain-containing protein [Phanerochaete sordida]|uniref:Cytochrome b mRNA-processing protein 4 n=1 Tax=Phanerochaete sordida TaxID=48140 RepID=A0A9P3G2F8_9APHY|nr:CBP4 domain-containing protein [Phanerochaete sordida]